jgi:hypothetical protein
MGQNLVLKCRCGQIRGYIKDASPSMGRRAVCYCDDCQAYAHYLGRAQDVLDANGGTDIFAVPPSRIEFTQGQNQIRCLRLTKRGLLRWYASCCKTPIANTITSHQMPYAGMVHSILDPGKQDLDEIIGPIRGRILGKFGIGKMPKGTAEKAPMGLMLSVGGFILKNWVTRQFKPSPFFDDAGNPRVAAEVVPVDEREYLRKFCGPK